MGQTNPKGCIIIVIVIIIVIHITILIVYDSRIHQCYQLTAPNICNRIQLMKHHECQLSCDQVLETVPTRRQHKQHSHTNTGHNHRL